MIRWITPFLGTGPASKIELEDNMRLLDVRDLVDKSGNNKESIQDKIKTGLEFLNQGYRVVVGCDYGISRSNAIAIGLLSAFKKISFEDALNQVVQSTGELEIKLGPLGAVRSALSKGNSEPAQSHKKEKIPNILVTGGTGFIGQNFLSKCSGDCALHAPDRSEIDLLGGAALLDIYAQKYDVSCCVHLANPRIYTSNRAMGDAVTMLRNVLEVCVDNDLHLIFPSTYEVYLGCTPPEGQKDAILIVDENTPLCPKGPYGESKYLCEHLIVHYRKKHGLKATILRSSLLYGPESSRPKFLSNFIAKALQGEEIYTHRYENAEPMLNMLHVSDFVSALHCSVKNCIDQDFNIGGDRLLKTHDIAQYVCERLGSESKVKYKLLGDNIVNIALNSKAINEQFNWKEKIVFEEGIDELLKSHNIKLEKNKGIK